MLSILIKHALKFLILKLFKESTFDWWIGCVRDRIMTGYFEWNVRSCRCVGTYFHVPIQITFQEQRNHIQDKKTHMVFHVHNVDAELSSSFQ